MNLQGPARRVTIIVGESDHHGHRPLYAEIVHRAHHAGLAGASVFRGMEGFGVTSRIHTNRLLSLSQDLPVMILIVDAAGTIDRFLRQIDDLIGDGLVLVDDVWVHRPGAPLPAPGDLTSGSQAT
jgi:PII-like signaling protein